jgi:hypothetical protein
MMKIATIHFTTYIFPGCVIIIYYTVTLHDAISCETSLQIPIKCDNGRRHANEENIQKVLIKWYSLQRVLVRMMKIATIHFTTYIFPGCVIIIYYTSCKNLLISLDNRHLTFLNSFLWCRNQIVIIPSAITPSRAELYRTGK